MTDTPLARRRKLPPRFIPIVFAFFMAAIMAFLMCSVIVAANAGITGTYHWQVLHAYSLAMPVAFLCVLMVRPLVLRIVGLICHMPGVL